MMSWGEVVEYSDFLALTHEGSEEFATPMRFAKVLHLDEFGRRRITPMRWGFPRRDAKDPNERPEHIHARAESIDTRPTFREAFLHRRGLLVVRSFNEGEELAPRRTVQHVIRPKDGKPLAIAVIWDRWVNRNDGELNLFVMITVPANALIGQITDRMPAIIRPEDWGRWLGEVPASPEEIKSLLRSFDGDWEMVRQSALPRAPKPPRPQPDLI